MPKVQPPMPKAQEVPPMPKTQPPTPKPPAPKFEDDDQASEGDVLKRLERQLQEFEEHARKRQELAEKKNAGRNVKLLSYEEGFSWCVGCKHVSTISSTSELKFKGLGGCQRKSCQKCFQWKRHQSPYEDGDFLYEGDKEQKDCPWYVTGKGCEDGNRCIFNHPKWDEKLPENKGRCYVCGQRGDHHSKYCERPGGGNEGFGIKDIEDRIPMCMPLPKRPNGEEAFTPQRQEDP
jgi:hypothetical protein